MKKKKKEESEKKKVLFSLLYFALIVGSILAVLFWFLPPSFVLAIVGSLEYAPFPELFATAITSTS